MRPFVGDFYRAIKWQIALIQSHTFSKAACGNTDFAVHSLDKSFPVAPAWVHPQDLSACTFVKYGIQIAISLTHPHGAWVVLSLKTWQGAVLVVTDRRGRAQSQSEDRRMYVTTIRRSPGAIGRAPPVKAPFTEAHGPADSFVSNMTALNSVVNSCAIHRL